MCQVTAKNASEREVVVRGEWVSVLEGLKRKGGTDIPAAAERMTHPFDLKTPYLQATKHGTALLVDAIIVLPQRLLVCERPGVLEIVVSAILISV